MRYFQFRTFRVEHGPSLLYCCRLDVDGASNFSAISSSAGHYAQFQEILFVGVRPPSAVLLPHMVSDGIKAVKNENVSFFQTVVEKGGEVRGSWYHLEIVQDKLKSG